MSRVLHGQAAFDQPAALKPGWEQDAPGCACWRLTTSPAKRSMPWSRRPCSTAVGLAIPGGATLCTKTLSSLQQRDRPLGDLARNSRGPGYGDNGYFWLGEGTRRGEGTPDWALIRVLTPRDGQYARAPFGRLFDPFTPTKG